MGILAILASWTNQRKFLPLEGRKTMHITNKASTAEVATPNTIFNHVYTELGKTNQAYVQFLLDSWND